MPLAYYRRLTRAQKRIYDRSDKIERVPVPRPRELDAVLRELQAGLDENSVRRTQKAAHRMVGDLLVQLEAPAVTVRVLARRPHDEYSELHGLYEHEEGRKPLIRAWMRTAVKQQPVAFRSFTRTLIHEVCHHLDFCLFDLDESFHTEGFFKREAHLARQLLGIRERPRSAAEPVSSSEPAAAEAKGKQSRQQTLWPTD